MLHIPLPFVFCREKLRMAVQGKFYLIAPKLQSPSYLMVNYCLSVWLSICLTSCLSVCLSVCLSIYLFVLPPPLDIISEVCWLSDWVLCVG